MEEEGGDVPDIQLALHYDRPHFFSGGMLRAVCQLQISSPLNIYQVVAVFKADEIFEQKKRRLIRPIVSVLEGTGSQPMPRGLGRIKKRISTELPAGEYRYELEFDLPAYLPPSVMFGRCRVRYLVKINVMGADMKSLHQQCFGLRLLGTQFDFATVRNWTKKLSRVQIRAPLFSFGRIRTTVHIDTQVFHIGDPLGGAVELKNGSNRKIRNLKIVLLRRYRNGRKWEQDPIKEKLLANTVPASGVFKSSQVAFEFKFVCPREQLTESVWSKIKKRGVSKLKWLAVVYYVVVRGEIRATRDLSVEVPVLLIFNRHMIESQDQRRTRETGDRMIAAVPIDENELFRENPALPDSNPEVAPVEDSKEEEEGEVSSDVVKPVTAPLDAVPGLSDLSPQIDASSPEILGAQAGNPLDYLSVGPGMAPPTLTDVLSQEERAINLGFRQPEPMPLLRTPTVVPAMPLGGQFEPPVGDVLSSDAVVFDLSSMFAPEPVVDPVKPSPAPIQPVAVSHPKEPSLRMDDLAAQLDEIHAPTNDLSVDRIGSFLAGFDEESDEERPQLVFA